MQHISQAPITNINTPSTEKSANKRQSRMPIKMVEPPVTNNNVENVAVTKDHYEITNVSHCSVMKPVAI